MCCTHHEGRSYINKGPFTSLETWQYDVRHRVTSLKAHSARCFGILVDRVQYFLFRFSFLDTTVLIHRCCLSSPWRTKFGNLTNDYLILPDLFQASCSPTSNAHLSGPSFTVYHICTSYFGHLLPWSSLEVSISHIYLRLYPSHLPILLPFSSVPASMHLRSYYLVRRLLLPIITEQW